MMSEQEWKRFNATHPLPDFSFEARLREDIRSQGIYPIQPSKLNSLHGMDSYMKTGVKA